MSIRNLGSKLDVPRVCTSGFKVEGLVLDSSKEAHDTLITLNVSHHSLDKLVGNFIGPDQASTMFGSLYDTRVARMVLRSALASVVLVDD